MNRPIEFRGKRKDNGEWVQGCANIMQNGDAYIFRFSVQTSIKPETLSEYTGRDDIHGTRMYEGDIARAGYLKADKSIIWFKVGEITFSSSGFSFGKTPLSSYGADALFEVVGNIYDNKTKKEAQA